MGKTFQTVTQSKTFYEQIQFWKEHNFKDLEIHNWVKLAKRLEIGMPEDDFNKINAEPLV